MHLNPVAYEVFNLLLCPIHSFCVHFGVLCMDSMVRPENEIPSIHCFTVLWLQWNVLALLH